MKSDRFIVGEVSKNWGPDAPDGPLLSEMFQEVIAVNLGRGYKLHSFSLHRMATGPDSLNETIVAVFEYDPEQARRREIWGPSGRPKPTAPRNGP